MKTKLTSNSGKITVETNQVNNDLGSYTIYQLKIQSEGSVESILLDADEFRDLKDFVTTITLEGENK